MTTPAADRRDPERQAKDEQRAAAPLLAAPDVLPDAMPAPVEIHLTHLRRPLAVTSIVENGLILGFMVQTQ